MRIIYAAFAAVLINVLYLVSYRGLLSVPPAAWSEDVDILKDLLVLLLTVWLLIEGLLSRRKKLLAKDRVSEVHETEKAVRCEELALLREELNEALEKREALKVAFREQEVRLEKAEEQAQLKKRPASVDGEIVNLLAMFQEKGRLVDFLMDDITPYSDEQVGAAARVVHQGCAAVLRDCFWIQPVQEKREGERITLQPGYEQREYRLMGKVTGEPPFCGTLVHRGWLTEEVKLPRLNLTEDSGQKLIISPAEVEL